VSDDILDEPPLLDWYENIRQGKSPGYTITRWPSITVFDKRTLTGEEKQKLRILSAVYAVARLMELDRETGAEAARIALRLYGQPHGLRASDIVAAAIAAAMERGIAVTRESVERAYELLTSTSRSGPASTPTDELHIKVERSLMRIIMDFNIKVKKEDIIASYVNIMANAIGADDISRIPMIALARAIDTSRPGYSAAAAVGFFGKLMRLSDDDEPLWRMIWPPVKRKRFVLDSASLSVGTGDVEAPDVGPRTVTVVCARCGAVLHSVNYKPPSPMHILSVRQAPLFLPSVCPRCGARIWDGNRLIVRSVKVTFNYRQGNNKVKKIKASAMMPLESSIAINGLASSPPKKARFSAVKA